MRYRWIQALFPYRAFLESEIEYLKTILAQRDRRIVELEDRLCDRPIMQPAQSRGPVTYMGSLAPVRGWDDYRSRKRGQRFEEAGEEASPPVRSEAVEDMPAGA